MSKRHSLQYQLISAVRGVFQEKIPRGYLKKKIKNKTATKEEILMYECSITSYKTLDNIIKFCKSFCNFLRKYDYYDDYRYAYELDCEIFGEYLIYVAKKTKSKNTIKTYKSYVRKLEKICSYYYKGSYFNFSGGLDEYLKDIDWENLQDKKIFHTLPVGDYVRFVGFLSSREWEELTETQRGLLIQAIYGLRCVEVRRLHWRDILTWEEVLKICDIEFSKMLEKYKDKKLIRPFYFLKSPYNAYIKVRGKAGQIRFVPCLFPAQYQLWRFLRLYREENNLPNDKKIVSCNDYDMRHEMKRILIKELKMSKYKSVPSSTHMLRKRVAKYVYEADTKKRFERVLVHPNGNVEILKP